MGVSLVLAVEPATYITGLTALVGSLVAYLVGIRGKSGRVATSEAETLWREASAMREAYRQEAERLRQDVHDLRVEVLGLRSDVVTLRQEAVTWRKEALRLRAGILDAKTSLYNEEVAEGS